MNAWRRLRRAVTVRRLMLGLLFGALGTAISTSACGCGYEPTSTSSPG